MQRMERGHAGNTERRQPPLSHGLRHAWPELGGLGRTPQLAPAMIEFLGCTRADDVGSKHMLPLIVLASEKAPWTTIAESDQTIGPYGACCAAVSVVFSRQGPGRSSPDVETYCKCVTTTLRHENPL
jgi:hypothetical protein